MRAKNMGTDSIRKVGNCATNTKGRKDWIPLFMRWMEKPKSESIGRGEFVPSTKNRSTWYERRHMDPPAS